jgi:hypothetical protein
MLRQQPAQRGLRELEGVLMADQVDVRENAALLRRLLAAVERGELTAETPQARSLLRRLEGAVAALEALDPSEPEASD